MKSKWLAKDNSPVIEVEDIVSKFAEPTPQSVKKAKCQAKELLRAKTNSPRRTCVMSGD